MDDVTEQIYGDMNADTQLTLPQMNGFVNNAVKVARMNNYNPYDAMGQTMSYFTQEDLPVTYALATQYAIIDNWFASVPGPTYPNRHFINCKFQIVFKVYLYMYDRCNSRWRGWK